MKRHRRSALFFAATQGVAAAAANSLRAGPYTEIWSLCNHTPLMVAAMNNHPSVVSQLLTVTDVEVSTAPNRRVRTPLSHAACHGSTETAKLLLDHGANIEPPDVDQKTPLMLAAANGHYGTARLLLEYGAAVGTNDRNGRTALAWAAGQGWLDIVDLLLEHGAEVDSTTAIGTTPLVLAVRNGHDEVVKRLLEVGADPNVRSLTGWTCLHFAAFQRPKLPVVKRLLEAGSDPRATISGNFRAGATPADLAHAAEKSTKHLEEICSLLNVDQEC